MKNKLLKLFMAVSVMAVIAGCGNQAAETAKPAESVQEETAQAEEAEPSEEAAETESDKSAQIASADEMAEPAEDIAEGLTAVTADQVADGSYEIDVVSSSKMFKITACTLTVENGEMSAVMTMGGTGYAYIYMGTCEEAVEADEADYVKPVENENEEHTFEVKVEALDKALDLAAFSKKKEKWYPRQVVFKTTKLPADALLATDLKSVEDLGLSDGVYSVEVTMEGGSGKASISSPCKLEVIDGVAYARIVWSSSKYDYMLVNGEKYLPLEGEETSTFVIPISGFDGKVNVIADTTAMGSPHEIEYKLTFDSETVTWTEESSSVSWGSLKMVEKTNLEYATQFSVETYTYGYKLLSIADSGRFLVVPFAHPVPADLPKDITVVSLPVKNGYLISSSSMDLICEIGALHSISLAGGKKDDWVRSEMTEAMENGRISYAGKYSEPDYELILAKGCDLAIYNTMITHKPEVKEKMESFDIPVVVEKSSYEEHPLGRLEWIKFYGALFGKEKKAAKVFDTQVKKAQTAMEQPKTDKTVAVFYITGNGTVNVRKANDYISKMIALAGGNYVFADLKPEEENSLSTVNISLEEFYAKAKSCDYLIYNSTITGEIETLDKLLEACPVLAGCEAVKNGHVYCTSQNFFQEMTKMPDFMVELGEILREEASEGKILFQIQ